MEKKDHPQRILLYYFLHSLLYTLLCSCYTTEFSDLRQNTRTSPCSAKVTLHVQIIYLAVTLNNHFLQTRNITTGAEHCKLSSRWNSDAVKTLRDCLWFMNFLLSLEDKDLAPLSLCLQTLFRNSDIVHGQTLQDIYTYISISMLCISMWKSNSFLHPFQSPSNWHNDGRDLHAVSATGWHRDQ